MKWMQQPWLEFELVILIFFSLPITVTSPKHPYHNYLLSCLVKPWNSWKNCRRLAKNDFNSLCTKSILVFTLGMCLHIFSIYYSNLIFVTGNFNTWHITVTLMVKILSEYYLIYITHNVNYIYIFSLYYKANRIHFLLFLSDLPVVQLFSCNINFDSFTLATTELIADIDWSNNWLFQHWFLLIGIRAYLLEW